MRKIVQYLVIHCADTIAGREVSKSDIEKWHKGPSDNPDGSVTYLGVKYPNRDSLPGEMIGGVSIKRLKGRGWRKPGYRDLFHLNGGVEVITPYNDDEYIDQWEITNGVAGINQEAAHICYAGGKGGDTRTTFQKQSMKEYVLKFVRKFPHVKVGGHYQFDKRKACPSFDVPQWLRSIGVEEKNIYRP